MHIHGTKQQAGCKNGTRKRPYKQVVHPSHLTLYANKLLSDSLEIEGHSGRAQVAAIERWEGA